MPIKRESCNAKTKTGKPCRAAPGPSGYCFAHVPGQDAKRQATRKRGGSRTPAKILKLDGTTPIHTPAKINKLLDELILETMETTPTLGGAFNLKKSRTVGYLAGIKLRASKLSELEARVATLEGKRKKK